MFSSRSYKKTENSNFLIIFGKYCFLRKSWIFSSRHTGFDAIIIDNTSQPPQVPPPPPPRTPSNRGPFAGNPNMGLIMLPLMLYHQLQLMACAVMAQRYARKASVLEAEA